jgi:hypothetical protein
MKMQPLQRKEATMEKKITEYVAPKIEDHGDLAELTAGKSVGAELDADFPKGTPSGDLGFTTP